MSEVFAHADLDLISQVGDRQDGMESQAKCAISLQL